jgi:surface protein
VGEKGTVNGVEYTKRDNTASYQITEANAATTCTSGITDMNSLFKNKGTFNADISSWDVSSVTNMNEMFNQATAFNANISSWDVSSVTTMQYMFSGADAFNGDISKWDVSSVTHMDICSIELVPSTKI